MTLAGYGDLATLSLFTASEESGEKYLGYKYKRDCECEESKGKQSI